MGFHSCRLAFPNLHAGSSEMNESLNALGLGSRSAEGMPEAVPRLMGLPVKTGIEKRVFSRICG